MVKKLVLGLLVVSAAHAMERNLDTPALFFDGEMRERSCCGDCTKGILCCGAGLTILSAGNQILGDKFSKAAGGLFFGAGWSGYLWPRACDYALAAIDNLLEVCRSKKLNKTE